METAVFVFGIIGVIASLYASWDSRKEHVDKPKEEKDFLIVQFMSTRSLSISVSEQLNEYARKHNAYDQFILPDTTIATYLKLLRQSQETNLSEETLENALKLPLTSPIIQSMTKSLENQFNGLLQIDGWVKAKMMG